MVVGFHPFYFGKLADDQEFEPQNMRNELIFPNDFEITIEC
jgi:hypothetical protein